MAVIDQFVTDFIEDMPKQAAVIISQMGIDETAAFLRGIEVTRLMPLLPYLSKYTVAKLIEQVSDDNALRIVADLPSYFSASALLCCSRSLRESLVNRLDSKKRKSIVGLLGFNPDTAGMLMDSRLGALPATNKVETCLKQIRGGMRVSKYVYGINEDLTLIGACSLTDLLKVRDQSVPLGSLLVPDVVAIRFDESIQEVEKNPHWELYSALPVVDGAGKYVGVIHFSSILTWRRRERGSSGADSLGLTGAALGELYQLGLHGLLESAGTTLRMKES